MSPMPEHEGERRRVTARPRRAGPAAARGRGAGAARSAPARRADAGLTLIEIMVVVLVLGILAALVVPNVFSHVETAKIEAARSQIELFGAALDAYRLHNGRYPTSEQGLEALRREPLSEPRPTSWRGPYLRKEIPLDPWGNPYVYRSPGEVNPWGYDLLSHAKDGRPGGDGEDADITSWE